MGSKKKNVQENLDIDEAISSITRIIHAFQDSREWLQTTLNSIGDAVIATDTKGRVTFVNPVAEKLTGWKEKEAKGKSIKSVFNIKNENTGKTSVNPIERVLKEGVVVGLANHTLLVAKNGKIIPIDDSSAPIIDTNGEIIGAVLVFHDITERKKMEAKNNHLNQVLRAIRNVNQLITQEKDRDKLLEGTCESLINDRGYKNAWIVLQDEDGKFFASAESGIGKEFQKMFKLLQVGELTVCAKEAFKSKKVIITQKALSQCNDCPLAKKNLECAWMTNRLEHNGKIYGLMSVSILNEFIGPEDVSLFKEVSQDLALALATLEEEEMRKQAEESIINEKKRAELYRDILSHDITNQNQGVIGLLEFTLDNMDDSGQNREEIHMALDQAWAISNLIKNVKTLSKIKENTFGLKSVDIGSTLLFAIKRVQSSNPYRKIKVVHSIPKSKLSTKANDLLVDVFENILGNSVKFDRSEIVEIELKYSSSKDGKYWKLEFKDHGPGIPDEMKGLIFKRLQRGDKSRHGSGIGLAIVDSLVELLNGKVWVEDRVKGDHTKGSNFKLLLTKEVSE